MEPAELVAIVGSSGSGKSTLLHTLGDLISQVVGKCLLMDNPLKKASANELAVCVIVI